MGFAPPKARSRLAATLDVSAGRVRYRPTASRARRRARRPCNTIGARAARRHLLGACSKHIEFDVFKRERQRAIRTVRNFRIVRWCASAVVLDRSRSAPEAKFHWDCGGLANPERSGITGLFSRILLSILGSEQLGVGSQERRSFVGRAPTSQFLTLQMPGSSTECG